jgi:hypothetical protein
VRREAEISKTYIGEINESIQPWQTLNDERHNAAFKSSDHVSLQITVERSNDGTTFYPLGKRWVNDGIA